MTTGYHPILAEPFDERECDANDRAAERRQEADDQRVVDATNPLHAVLSAHEELCEAYNTAASGNTDHGKEAPDA